MASYGRANAAMALGRGLQNIGALVGQQKAAASAAQEREQERLYREQQDEEARRWRTAALLTQPGVEVIQPTVQRVVDLPEPSRLPPITVTEPTKPTALERAANDFAPAALPEPDFRRPISVEERNPALEGKTPLLPGQNVFYNPRHREEDSLRERTLLRDRAVAAGVEPGRADLLLSAPTLVGNLLPEPTGISMYGRTFPDTAAGRREALAWQRAVADAGRDSERGGAGEREQARRRATARATALAESGAIAPQIWADLEQNDELAGILTQDEVLNIQRRDRPKPDKKSDNPVLDLVRERVQSRESATSGPEVSTSGRQPPEPPARPTAKTAAERLAELKGAGVSREQARATMVREGYLDEIGNVIR